MIRGYCTVCQDVISHINGQEQGEIATGPCILSSHLLYVGSGIYLVPTYANSIVFFCFISAILLTLII